jgi:geranylgeranylglycerol-phosphate geranylgeranyltransferase
MRVARSIAKLIRLDTSVFTAFAVFAPIFARTKDLGLSLQKAIPLLFIGACTFIANDLNDAEKDRINHPERPLPSGHIAPSFAVALYFMCLGLALLATKYWVEGGLAFWYFLLLIMSISYSYIIEYFPEVKSAYVASATSIPVLIVANSYPAETRLYRVALSIALFSLGEEICMDVLDRPGDSASFMHEINSKTVARIAFTLQAVAILSLAAQVDNLPGLADLFLIAFLFSSSCFYWFKIAGHKMSITLMRAQIVIGLYFML